MTGNSIWYSSRARSASTASASSSTRYGRWLTLRLARHREGRSACSAGSARASSSSAGCCRRSAPSSRSRRAWSTCICVRFLIWSTVGTAISCGALAGLGYARTMHASSFSVARDRSCRGRSLPWIVVRHRALVVVAPAHLASPGQGQSSWRVGPRSRVRCRRLRPADGRCGRRPSDGAASTAV